jgi:tetratricopeptide (TPR) repeat protein
MFCAPFVLTKDPETQLSFMDALPSIVKMRTANIKHIDMIKKLLFLVLVLISANSFAKIGDNNDYWIISQNDYNERISKGKDVLLRRYIIVPSIDKKYKDLFETRDEKALLAKFSFMLNRNKASWIDKYIKNCDNSLDINNLIKGLYYFSKKRYNQAIAHLENIENSEYRFLQLLMIADCKYEMLQDKKNYKTIIGAYQVALDCTDNEQNKAIINNRIKYIKYQ